MGSELENRHWREVGRLEGRIQELEKERNDLRIALEYCLLNVQKISDSGKNAHSIAQDIVAKLMQPGLAERDLSEGGDNG